MSQNPSQIPCILLKSQNTVLASGWMPENAPVFNVMNESQHTAIQVPVIAKMHSGDLMRFLRYGPTRRVLTIGLDGVTKPFEGLDDDCEIAYPNVILGLCRYPFVLNENRKLIVMDHYDRCTMQDINDEMRDLSQYCGPVQGYGYDTLVVIYSANEIDCYREINPEVCLYITYEPGYYFKSPSLSLYYDSDDGGWGGFLVFDTDNDGFITGCRFHEYHDRPWDE